jgi:SET domain-containing protein
MCCLLVVSGRGGRSRTSSACGTTSTVANRDISKGERLYYDYNGSEQAEIRFSSVSVSSSCNDLTVSKVD